MIKKRHPEKEENRSIYKGGGLEEDNTSTDCPKRRRKSVPPTAPREGGK
jgi:hypothetical protein